MPCDPASVSLIHVSCFHQKGEPVNKEDIFVAVKTCRKFHSERGESHSHSYRICQRCTISFWVPNASFSPLVFSPWILFFFFLYLWHVWVDKSFTWLSRQSLSPDNSVVLSEKDLMASCQKKKKNYLQSSLLTPTRCRKCKIIQQ